MGQDEILSAFDAATGDLKASVSLPGAVHGFRIDKKAGKIYAVLTRPNLIVVVDLSNHEIVARLETRKDSRTCAWKAGKIYLGVPQQEETEGPEIRIYEARPVIAAKPAVSEKN